MAKIGETPFVWVEFDKEAKLKTPQAIAELNTALAAPGVTDLVVLSHGWQNERKDAEKLYSRLWPNVATALKAAGRDPARMVIAGILWPSKAYNADYDGGGALMSEAKAAGLLSTGGGKKKVTDLSDAGFEALLKEVGDFLGDDAAAKAAIAAARTAAAQPSAANCRAFFSALQSATGADPKTDDKDLAQEARIFTRTGNAHGALTTVAVMSMPIGAKPPEGGQTKDLGDLAVGVFQGTKNGLAWLLNKGAYYRMKELAGEVGKTLGKSVLPQLQAPAEVRLHLVGHSFGARLVTAAANALPPIPKLPFQSLTLLQGAFSHFAMTEGRGPFSKVVGKPRGAIAMTHTHNDLACSVAYPLASMLVGDASKSLGGKNNPFSSMGANGAQLAAAAVAKFKGAAAFQPRTDKVNLFLADDYVVAIPKSAGPTATDAHNNVHNPDCGRLVAATMLA